MTDGEARLRVLVCDDDPLICDVVCDVLRAEPDLDVVAVARDADAAISLAERHRPAVVVLDFRMPRGGGPHAAREIRRRSPNTRILAFSAYGDSGAREEMRAAGVAAYVLKGTPIDDIVATVRGLATRTPR